MIGLFLWFPRATLGRLFRPVNRWFDTIEADVECLVKLYQEGQN